MKNAAVFCLRSPSRRSALFGGGVQWQSSLRLYRRAAVGFGIDLVPLYIVQNIQRPRDAADLSKYLHAFNRARASPEPSEPLDAPVQYVHRLNMALRASPLLLQNQHPFEAPLQVVWYDEASYWSATEGELLSWPLQVEHWLADETDY